MVTSVEGVFTAGDCAFGPDTVIRAVSEGKQAAKAINLYLSGAKVEIKKGIQSFPWQTERSRYGRFLSKI